MTNGRPSGIKNTRCKCFDPYTKQPRDTTHPDEHSSCLFAHPCDGWMWDAASVNKLLEGQISKYGYKPDETSTSSRDYHSSRDRAYSSRRERSRSPARSADRWGPRRSSESNRRTRDSSMDSNSTARRPESPSRSSTSDTSKTWSSVSKASPPRPPSWAGPGPSTSGGGWGTGASPAIANSPTSSKTPWGAPPASPQWGGAAAVSSWGAASPVASGDRGAEQTISNSWSLGTSPPAAKDVASGATTATRWASASPPPDPFAALTTSASRDNGKDNASKAMISNVGKGKERASDALPSSGWDFSSVTDEVDKGKAKERTDLSASSSRAQTRSDDQRMDIDPPSSGHARANEITQAVKGSVNQEERKETLKRRVKVLNSLVEAESRNKELKAAIRECESQLPQLYGASAESGQEKLATMRVELQHQMQQFDTLLDILLSEDDQDWPFGDTIKTVGSDGKSHTRVVVTSPKGLKGMIKATMFEIETLKKRQLAILSSESAQTNTGAATAIGAAAPSAIMGSATTPAASPPTSPPTSRKRKASHASSPIIPTNASPSFNKNDDDPDTIARIQEAQSNLMLLQTKLHEVENSVSKWREDSLAAVDSRLSDLRLVREEERKKAQSKEEEDTKLVGELESLELENQEKVRKVLSESEQLDKEKADMEAEHEALMSKFNKTEEEQGDMLHSLRALTQQRQALQSLPSPVSPTSPPTISRELIEQLKRRIANETRSEYTTLLEQRNAEFIARTQKKQDDLVHDVLESLRPSLLLQQMVLEFVGADDKQRHLGDVNQDYEDTKGSVYVQPWGQ